MYAIYDNICANYSSIGVYAGSSLRRVWEMVISQKKQQLETVSCAVESNSVKLVQKIKFS